MNVMLEFHLDWIAIKMDLKIICLIGKYAKF